MRLVAAVVAALVLAPAALALAPGETPSGNLPAQKGGSSIGEGLPFKAYASMTPTVHLFGDQVTAKLAVVADTKYVDPLRLRVRTDFKPYVPVAAPAVARVVAGRFEQITWTWQIRCIDSACVPRVPTSDKFHVFHFSPAHIDYVTLQGKPAYGLNAYWPPVEVISQISPGVQKFLQLTNHIGWRFDFRPVGAPTYRFSPTTVLWVALGLAGVFGAGALFFFGRWYLLIRPRRTSAAELPGTPLERALAVLRYAHETGDETLQRKAFERVADELGVAQADELTRTARELAWSPRTPEDEEVEAFAAQALEASE
ncbi:MAG: hypothetical protein ABUS54_02030 [Actinomycetota bacterium]